MERLTYKYNDGYAINLPNAISGKDETLRWSISERESGLRLEGEIPNRLAAYEDTGLEPQEIKSLQAEWVANLRALDAYRALGSVDRLRELAQADREGRCVILPAGIGDTVYHITTGLYCPCELAETCPFPCDDDGSFDCEKHKNTLAIFEDVVAGVFIEDMQDVITFGYSGSADFEDFGKTVFLTREEADAALRREQDGQIKP